MKLFPKFASKEETAEEVRWLHSRINRQQKQIERMSDDIEYLQTQLLALSGSKPIPEETST